MSRVRPVDLPNGERIWFDIKKSADKATPEQLELLVTVEELDLDDLLEEDLSQGDILRRLRKALGQGGMPPDVISRRERWRRERQTQPQCRLCQKVGDSTRHHFVNKWILKELGNYASKWADRTRNCIPLCIECHQNVHSRSRGIHSIAPFLTTLEKEFAEDSLKALGDERPKLLILIARGDDSVYECRLVKDWIEGRFRSL